MTQLYHYTDLLRKLQLNSSSPVVACRVNGLGLVLLSLGIAGISSGIGSLDSFRESILSDTQEGYSADPRYYIPALMSMVTLKKRVTTKLIDIAKSSVGEELKCNCAYCAGIEQGTISLQNMKLHFMKKRKEEVEEIVALRPEDRLEYIESKVEKAITYKRTLSKEGVEVGDFSHLDTWYNLIQQFKK